MKTIKNKLYEVNRDIKCSKCGHIGAVRFYGNYYPNGLRNELDDMGAFGKKILEGYREKPYMSNAMGFGGTIPWACTNCGNVGLDNIDGLEGYKKTFESL